MTVAAGYRPTITAACCQTLVVEPGSDIQPQPRKSRASAVTTAASTTATITGVLSASATAATPTPRAFSSSSRWPPSPKVPVTTRAVSRAGVSNAITAFTRGGSSRPGLGEPVSDLVIREDVVVEVDPTLRPCDGREPVVVGVGTVL